MTTKPPHSSTIRSTFVAIAGQRHSSRNILLALGATAILVLGPQAQGVTITGGIGLLTMAGGTQLESWLGEGPLALTSIFSHTVGDGKDSYDFHAAADGQGRTFAIMEILSVNGVAVNEIIGGYNPQSWNSSGSYNLTPNDADRTAAIFNLTDLVWRPQDTMPNDSYDGGLYQT